MPARSAPADPRVGVVARRGRFTVVEPFFERGRRMSVDLRGHSEVRVGDLVLVRPRPDGRGRGERAEVLRALGRPGIPRDVVEALLADRGYARGFDRSVEKEARALAQRGAGEGSRRDLTDLTTFTIDPASARDFDDAVSAEPDGDGVRLSVHIADVSAFVRSGSALDREAEKRGNSVYVPGTVEPMLPLALSADACSLVPNAERPTVTVEIRFDAGGNVRAASFYRSTIRSNARLTYEDVDAAFAGSQPVPDVVRAQLALSRSVAAGLREQRVGKGGLGLETSEPEFEFGDDGQVSAARDVVQTEAHGLIEQLMVCANEQVALRLETAKAPAIFRIHEQPDPEAVEFLVAQLESLEVPTPPLPKRISARQAGQAVGEISNLLLDYMRTTGRGRIAFTSLVLRSLKQAIYSPGNIGHAGLASASYCHFTSPIRRYPDLVVHRSLLSMLGDDQAPPAHALEEVAAHCTATERAAMSAERDADDICQAFMLERELTAHGWDEVFEGEVTGVIAAGAFISFRWQGVGATCEGFLPVRRIGGDWFDINEQRTMLIGRESGRRVRLGDPIRVRVRGVEPPRGRVDLEQAGDRS